MAIADPFSSATSPALRRCSLTTSTESVLSRNTSRSRTGYALFRGNGFPRLFAVVMLSTKGNALFLQYSITAIGSVVIQTAINSLGSIAVASVTAGQKIGMFFCCPFDALGGTMATYAGQNAGAGKLTVSAREFVLQPSLEASTRFWHALS